MENPRPQGHQNDGAGELWCAVAETEWGQIPGKANHDTCWFPYGGQEHSTTNFVRKHAQQLVPQPQGPPHGHQNDGAGELWCAVARTQWGNIPGKAKGGTCWFPYGGQEHSTTDFSYLAESPQGFQNDGAGPLWCAVAETEWGRIPGKANATTCWYPYGSQERSTQRFTIMRGQRFERAPSGPAPGHQNDGSGNYWCAVARTQWGNIPGKAKDGTCWFPYGGQEHATSDFWYVSEH